MKHTIEQMPRRRKCMNTASVRYLLVKRGGQMTRQRKNGGGERANKKQQHTTQLMSLEVINAGEASLTCRAAKLLLRGLLHRGPGCEVHRGWASGPAFAGTRGRSGVKSRELSAWAISLVCLSLSTDAYLIARCEGPKME